MKKGETTSTAGGPPDADLGISGGERQKPSGQGCRCGAGSRPPVSGECGSPRQGSACTQARLVSRVCPRCPPHLTRPFSSRCSPLSNHHSLCVDRKQSRCGACMQAPAPCMGCSSLPFPPCQWEHPLLSSSPGSSHMGRFTRPDPAHDNLTGTRTMVSLPSMSSVTRNSASSAPDSCLVLSFCGSLASLFLLEARLDPASSSDAPKVRGCGPVSGEGERREVVLGPWEHDPPM